MDDMNPREAAEHASKMAYMAKLEYSRLAAIAHDLHEKVEAFDFGSNSAEDSSSPFEPKSFDWAGKGPLNSICVVVLVRPCGPVNLGLISRACSNMGIRQLRLVDPQCTVDSKESRRFANHAGNILLDSKKFKTLKDAVGDCQYVVGTSGVNSSTSSLSELFPIVSEKPFKKFALVFGNEAEGLGALEMEYCDMLIRLDTWGHPSFNLSHAVAIVLYSLSLEWSCSAQSGSPIVKENQLASKSQLEILRTQTFRLLQASGFLHKGNSVDSDVGKRQLESRFTSLFKHSSLNCNDVGALQSVLKHLIASYTDETK